MVSSTGVTIHDHCPFHASQDVYAEQARGSGIFLSHIPLRTLRVQLHAVTALTTRGRNTRWLKRV